MAKTVVGLFPSDQQVLSVGRDLHRGAGVKDCPYVAAAPVGGHFDHKAGRDREEPLGVRIESAHRGAEQSGEERESRRRRELRLRLSSSPARVHRWIPVDDALLVPEGVARGEGGSAQTE